jgi:ribosomal protein L9
VSVVAWLSAPNVAVVHGQSRAFSWPRQLARSRTNKNRTQHHKDEAKRDGCERARHAHPRPTHFQHEMREKRAFLIFSKITKKERIYLNVLTMVQM